MINLLPPQDKIELILEKNKKLIMILGNIFLISLLCLVLVLFSLKFYILGEINSQKIILDESEKKYQTPDFLLFKNAVEKYNSLLTKIDHFYNQETYLTDSLKSIFEIQRPTGLYFTSINLTRAKESGNIKVVVSGVSDTRDNLLIFRDNIKNDKSIQNIYFPSSDLLKPKDLNFSFNFEITNNENPK